MSRKPRTQRTQDRDAPLHRRHRAVRATLSDELREEYDRRNARVNAGDTVEVMRGDHAGETGEVLRVDLKEGHIHVEGVTVETAEGEEVARPIPTSNVRITDLALDDPRRRDRLEGDES